MIKIPIENQKKFFNWQVEEYEQEKKKYLNTSMNRHYIGRSAYFGKLHGIDQVRKTFIIKFKRGYAPRLAYGMLGIVYSGVPDASNPENWTFTYQQFRIEYARATSEMTPIYFTSSNPSDNHVYVGFNEISDEFYEIILKIYHNGKRPSFVLAEKDPPIEYLLNLRNFVSKYTLDTDLNMDLSKALDDWHPKQLLEKDNKKEIVLSNLEKEAEIVLQGPPGTGKSYLIAQICDYYLQRDNTVCVTALTNKALTELARKEHLGKWLKLKKLFKTNLTTNEKAELKDIEPAKNLRVGKGELLLATYYKLSSWFSPESPDTLVGQPYDVIIIEEASQSYLATIAAFKKLGKKILIVGDPLQLPPIVLNESNSNIIHPHIMKYARGLESYAANSGKTAFRLVETYRLNPYNTKHTGVFYSNQLISKNTVELKVSSSKRFQYLLSDSSNLLCVDDISMKSDGYDNFKKYIVDFVKDLRQNNPSLNIAVLAPFKNTVKQLQEMLSQNLNDLTDITIETVDRIQGLTVDITIYLMIIDPKLFGLNLNRFNVATSRAKYKTVIFTDRHYINLLGIDPRVTQFLTMIDHKNIQNKCSHCSKHTK
jgi:DNA replication ATP-dependent helicase Dna2